MDTYWLFQWRQPKSHVVLNKLDIYVFNTIIGSIPLLMDYCRGYHSPSSQWFGTDMVYWI